MVAVQPSDRIGEDPPPGHEDWKMLYNKRAPRAICLHHSSATASPRLSSPSSCCPHTLPWVHPAAGPLPTSCYCQPLDIPTGGPEPGVEAGRGRRQYWEKEGRAPSGSFFVPFGLVSSSPSLRPCAYTFGNMTGLLPKVARNSKVGHSHP